ncbi:hypothetical protein T484DRAFT_1782229 [Baffinella frigidus]|nr:hypothetical protein T484DRAFT_1782229 [Cryptophyta sp. CCMP2293]
MAQRHARKRVRGKGAEEDGTGQSRRVRGRASEEDGHVKQEREEEEGAGASSRSARNGAGRQGDAEMRDREEEGMEEEKPAGGAAEPDSEDDEDGLVAVDEMAAATVSAAPSMFSAGLPHFQRASFEPNAAPQGPLCVVEPLPCGKSVALREAVSNKRALPLLSLQPQGADAKVRRVDEDELELLDPSTGAAAAVEYDLIDGRFVEVHAPSMPADDALSASIPLLHVDVSQPRPDFDDLLLDQEGWRIWAESWGSADSSLALFAETAP